MEINYLHVLYSLSTTEGSRGGMVFSCVLCLSVILHNLLHGGGAVERWTCD